MPYAAAGCFDTGDTVAAYDTAPTQKDVAHEWALAVRIGQRRRQSLRDAFAKWDVAAVLGPVARRYGLRGVAQLHMVGRPTSYWTQRRVLRIQGLAPSANRDDDDDDVNDATATHSTLETFASDTTGAGMIIIYVRREVPVTIGNGN